MAKNHSFGLSLTFLYNVLHNDIKFLNGGVKNTGGDRIKTDPIWASFTALSYKE